MTGGGFDHSPGTHVEDKPVSNTEQLVKDLRGPAIRREWIMKAADALERLEAREGKATLQLCDIARHIGCDTIDSVPAMVKRLINSEAVDALAALQQESDHEH